MVDVEEQKTIIPLDDQQFPAEPGLRHLMPKDIKKEVRKEWHWFLWLRQMTYKEIEAITGFERTTIWKDLTEVQEELAHNPLDHQKTLQLAMMQLRFDHAEVIQRARDSESDKNAAELYKIAAQIQIKILERFTQPINIGEHVIRGEQDHAQAIIDFMVEKYGPESLDTFETWYSKKRVAKATMSSPKN